MIRRDFLVKSSLAMGVLSGLPSACMNLAPTSTKFRNWIWIGPKPENTVDDWKRQFDELLNHGVQSVLLEVWQGNKAFYGSSFLDSSGDMLERSLKAASDSGIELHAWMWSMPCLIPKIIEEHPEWYNVNAFGQSSSTDPAYVGYYKFLCPARPEPRDFIEKRVRELAAFEGLAGVHLDYIRHPDAILPRALWPKYNLVQDRVYPEFDYCYCDYCRGEFKKVHGIDPLDLEDPTTNLEWMQFRWDSVTDLVNDHLVPAARSQGKQVTAAVFPGPSVARTIVRQDWGKWDLDAFLPMLYHSFYEEGSDWIGGMVKEGISVVGARRMHSGLFVPGMKDEEEFTSAIQASLDSGANGISLFGMKKEWWPLFNQIANK